MSASRRSSGFAALCKRAFWVPDRPAGAFSKHCVQCICKGVANGHFLDHRGIGGGVANIFRVIVSIFLFFFSAHSFALISPEPTYDYYVDTPGVGTYESFAAACEGYRQYYLTQNPNSSYKNFVFDYTEAVTESRVKCWFQYQGSSYYEFDALRRTLAGACPANSESDGNGGCVCSSGFEDKDNQCRPINPCPSGQHEEFGVCVPDKCQPDETRVNGQCVKDPTCPQGEKLVNGVCIKDNKCEAGKQTGIVEVPSESRVYWCEMGCTETAYGQYDITYNGKTTYTGMATQTGSECTAGDGPSSPNPPGDGDGGDGGGTGGDGGGTGGTGGDGGGTGGTGGGGGGTGGDGGGTGGGTGGQPDSNAGDTPDKIPGAEPPDPVDAGTDGICPEGTTKVGTVCYPNKPKEPDDDGKCPKGYVKTGTQCTPLVPNGGGGGSGGGGGGDGDGGGSGFGGNCMAGFACEGDAIFCAMSREQYARNCALFDTPSDESKLYQENKGKEGNQTNDLPGNETIDLSGRIDTTNALGAGACFPDLNVTVYGQSITLPISVVCPWLGTLGQILVAVSLLLAARIVMRG